MNIIMHNGKHTLPDGFTVKDGYMSFRLGGRIWHTSGWVDRESGCIYCYRKDGSRFVGEWLHPEDESVLQEAIRRAHEYLPEVRPESSGLRITPYLAHVIGLVFADPDRVISVPTADQRAGNDENTNGGAYVCRAQFNRWNGAWWIRERWSCDGDLREIPDWVPVSDGEFVRRLAYAVCANRELAEDLQGESADSLFGGLFPGNWGAAWNRYAFLAGALSRALDTEGGESYAA